METINLLNNIKMPVLAIGTNWMNYSELKKVMKQAFLSGIRAIDTARDYGNEHIVGQVLFDLMKEMEIKREELFITTKIGNSQQLKGNISTEIDISLKNLKVEYLDLWLMHWPFPDYYVNTWLKMEKIYFSGKVKSIGVANFDVRHLIHLLSEDISVLPMVNQVEYHPLRTIPELTEFMLQKNIKLQAYSPLCRLVPALRENDLLEKLSLKYKKSIGQIILRWHIQQGFVMPIFKTYNSNRFTENTDIFDFSLTNSEMRAVFLLNQDYKYHLESVNCPGY